MASRAILFCTQSATLGKSDVQVRQLGPQKPFMHARKPLMQPPADALASFKGLHKDLRSYQGIDGKRKRDAIIVSEVVVELPQILSFQA
ncbi:MAG: hypothetical protein FRX49_09798 [Trebouxia sp. A1-2]|nr:MAG: hypothetical protein FRX49_09798 [Trebouxia sp. A1-2]